MNANFSFEVILLVAGYASAAYLLGSIPVAWLIARWATGQDLRRLGSGNIGVMNTAISVARWAGLIAFSGEIAKGVLAITIPRYLGAGEALTSLAILMTVVGTRWPIWLGFKGGRGNTAGLSACFLISPMSIVACLGWWSVARLVFKRSFIATRLTLVALPLIFWWVSGLVWFAVTGLGLSLLYLNAQQPSSDDHTIINQRWSGIWKFLTSPPRRGQY